jgi:alkylation response protein AidB-like acyl-CoA dehydrogenase
MKFMLTDEQASIQRAVEELARGQLQDRALHKLIDGDPAIADGMWQQLAALGMLGVAIPEEHGGLELGVLELALVAEALGYEAAPGPFLGHVLAALAITLGGDEAQRARWLPGLADGSIVATVALTESEAAWQPGEWTLGGDSLSGAKRLVPGGEQADLIVVGTSGGGLSVVEAEAAGVTRAAMQGLDLTRPLARVSFDGAAHEPLAAGSDAAPRMIDAGLCLIAADAFGVSRRCVDMAVAYTQQREQFGRTLAGFQAMRHQMVNMALEMEPCRGLYWFAAHAWDKQDSESTRTAALAKAHIADKSLQIARDNMRSTAASASPGNMTPTSGSSGRCSTGHGSAVRRHISPERRSSRSGDRSFAEAHRLGQCMAGPVRSGNCKRSQ